MVGVVGYFLSRSILMVREMGHRRNECSMDRERSYHIHHPFDNIFGSLVSRVAVTKTPKTF